MKNSKNKCGKLHMLLPALFLSLLLAGCGSAAGQSGAGNTDSAGDVSVVNDSMAAAAESKTEETDSLATDPVETQGQELHTNSFDLSNGTVVLNDGTIMPVLGIGTFRLSDEEAEESVYWALERGYSLIDTAAAYGNEEGVGRGVQRAIEDGLVTREDVFITTKLWPDNYNMAGIDAALDRLGVDYIDLLLLHQPVGDYIGGYKAMEEAVAQGKVRSIGLSNFSDEQYAEVASVATILPSVHQVETHLFNQQTAMRGFLDQYGSVLEAWFPLGGRGNTQLFLENETVLEIAEKYGKSAAQVILRWHIQDGHIAIPGSHNPDHIQENIEIFDFKLNKEEMSRLRALNQNAPFFPGMGATSEETQQRFEQWADEWGLEIGDFTEDNTSETTAVSEERKALVVYFSASGNTKRAAEVAAEELGADLFELIPADAYTEDDLNWRDQNSRVCAEHEDVSLQDIELVSVEVPDWDEYDVVLFGYPLWWREAAWPVNNFVRNNDFTGKKVITFCTSTSNGLGDSGKHLAEMAGTGNWTDGKRFSETADEGSIREWVQGLDLE